MGTGVSANDVDSDAPGAAVRSCLLLLQEPKQHTLVGQVIHNCLYRSFPQRKSVAMDRQEYPTMVVRLSVLRRRNNARNTLANKQEAKSQPLRKG